MPHLSFLELIMLVIGFVTMLAILILSLARR